MGRCRAGQAERCGGAGEGGGARGRRWGHEGEVWGEASVRWRWDGRWGDLRCPVAVALGLLCVQ